MALAAKKIEYPTNEHAAADAYLESLTDEAQKLAGLMRDYQARSDEVVAAYKDAIRKKKADIEAIEKKLKKFLKAHREIFFENTDRVDLKFGAVILFVQSRVKRAKEVLARLEEIEANEAIIVTKAVDWDVLETWTDERLIEVGTERRKDEKFEYELYERRVDG
jgi:phage host-nuclease inhibitor protein Gam